jgi:hypothetical protein
MTETETHYIYTKNDKYLSSPPRRYHNLRWTYDPKEAFLAKKQIDVSFLPAGTKETSVIPTPCYTLYSNDKGYRFTMNYRLEPYPFEAGTKEWAIFLYIDDIDKRIEKRKKEIDELEAEKIAVIKFKEELND